MRRCSRADAAPVNTSPYQTGVDTAGPARLAVWHLMQRPVLERRMMNVVARSAAVRERRPTGSALTLIKENHVIRHPLLGTASPAG